MAGFVLTRNSMLNLAYATAVEKPGRIYFDENTGAFYRFGKVDATVTLGKLFYMKTPATWIHAVHDHATAAHFAKTKIGGWPCFSGTTSLPFGWFWVGGPLDTTVLASITTDTNVADGDQLVADTAVDGNVKPYTLGTNDGYIVAVATGADSGSALTAVTATIFGR